MDPASGSRDTLLSQSTPWEWSPEELVCLQSAARVMRIPLSDLLRFAEVNATNSSHDQRQAGDLSLSSHAVHNIQSVSVNDEAGNASMQGLLTDHPTPAQLNHTITPNDGLSYWSTSTPLDLAPSALPTYLAQSLSAKPMGDQAVTVSSGDNYVLPQGFLESLSHPSQVSRYVGAPVHGDTTMGDNNSVLQSASLPAPPPVSCLLSQFNTAYVIDDASLLLGDIYNTSCPDFIKSFNTPDLSVWAYPQEVPDEPGNLAYGIDSDSDFLNEQEVVPKEIELECSPDSSAALSNACTTEEAINFREFFLRSSFRGNSRAIIRPNSRVGKIKKATRNALEVRRSVECMQQFGTCVSCSISHKSCYKGSDPTVCFRCKNLKYSMSKLPCIYLQIPDIVLFRTTTDPISLKPYTTLAIDNRIFNPIKDSNESEIKLFKLTQGFGTPLQLFAQKFDASVVDMSNISEATRSIYSHPYALADLDTATKDIKNFVLHSTIPYIKSKVDPSDIITWSIFSEACSVASKNTSNSDFLADVLSLWTAARTIEGGWRFYGTETLELTPNSEGIVPLIDAPMIDYQFSGIIVQQVLLPLRQKVLKRLYELTHAHTASNWFALFLANFVLLHTYGLLINQQRVFAQCRGANVRYTLMSLVRGIHAGSKTLLAHFHFICKGQKPFDIDWGSGKVPTAVYRMAKVTEVQAKFLCFLVNHIRQKLPLFAALSKTQDYETNYWFTGQLFLPDWKPPDTIEHSPSA